MSPSSIARLGKLLGRRSKTELVELLIGLASDDARFGDWLLRRLSSDEPSPAASEGIGPAESPARITAADYSPLQRGLDSLYRAGGLEPVLALAPDLLAYASADAESRGEASDVAAETVACVEVVFAALRQVDWRPIDKLIWYWDFLLQDRHSLLDGLSPPVDEALLPAQAWREAAEYFQIRLGEWIQNRGRSDFRSTAVHRDDLIGALTEALVRLGEVDAATDVFMLDLPHSHCYLPLVFHLADHGFEAEAESWARQGFVVTVGNRPDIAWSLSRYLESLARQRGEQRLQAAFRADEFLARPSLAQYRRLRSALEGREDWELVQLQLLAWLEYGDDPRRAPEWPLPDTGQRFRLDDHPMRQGERALELLVEILLDEDEIEAAARCFERMRWRRSLAQRIADAAIETHPEIARGLLEKIIESWIGEVRVKSYQEAASQLRRLQALCLRHHCQEAFSEFVSDLRSRHAAKQRLLEILDQIEAAPPVKLHLVGHGSGG